MNIDERLEALTHNVELLVSFHKDNEHRMAELVQTMDRLGNRNQRLEDLVTRVAESTLRLARVVEDPELAIWKEMKLSSERATPSLARRGCISLRRSRRVGDFKAPRVHQPP